MPAELASQLQQRQDTLHCRRSVRVRLESNKLRESPSPVFDAVAVRGRLVWIRAAAEGQDVTLYYCARLISSALVSRVCRSELCLAEPETFLLPTI